MDTYERAEPGLLDTVGDISPTIGAPRRPAEEQPPGPDTIMKVGVGFTAAKTLLSAVEIGLFTVLAEDPMNGPALAHRLGLHDRAYRDFFDTLVAIGMLDRIGDLYLNTPETDLYLDRRKPTYIGGLLEMANERLYPMWGKLTEALRTGRPQSEAANDPKVFDKLYSDPDRLRLFLGAMTGLSVGAGRAIAAKFPWSGARTFADVGCAQGAVAAQISLAHPHLSGMGFDLPQVQPIFSEYVESFGLSDRLTFQAGDFFTGSLPKVDVIVMGHILHDWDLETKRMLIRKVHEALPVGGAFIAHEAIIDDERRENVFGLVSSLNMLLETPGGFDFTAADGIGWLREAGFREARVEHLAGPDSMLVGIK